MFFPSFLFVVICVFSSLSIHPPRPLPTSRSLLSASLSLGLFPFAFFIRSLPLRCLACFLSLRIRCSASSYTWPPLLPRDKFARKATDRWGATKVCAEVRPNLTRIVQGHAPLYEGQVIRSSAGRTLDDAGYLGIAPSLEFWIHGAT